MAGGLARRLAAFPLCWDSPGSIENSRWKPAGRTKTISISLFENLSGQDRAENALAMWSYRQRSAFRSSGARSLPAKRIVWTVVQPNKPNATIGADKRAGVRCSNMTKIAREFLDRWINVHIASLTHDADDTEAKGSARMCVADAEQHGISHVDLEGAAAGDLVAFMAGKIRKAVRREEKRVADDSC